MKPLVTVLMPVYNGGKFLNEAIESILSQTFKDFEFLIIDDGSTDKSLGVINKYAAEDKRIRVISRPNKGLVATLNEGIEQAKGRYIARMDADDVSLPDRLKKQVAALDKDRSLGIVGALAKIVDDNSKYVKDMIYPMSDAGCRLHMCRNTVFAHAVVMGRKEVFRKFLYDENSWPAEDYDLWQRASKEWRLANIPEFLLLYRVSESSISSSNAEAQLMLANRLAQKQIKDLSGHGLKILSGSPSRILDIKKIKGKNNRAVLVDAEVSSLRLVFDESRGVNKLLVFLSILISFLSNISFWRTYLHNYRLLGVQT